MKSIKKILSLALALMLALSLSVTAFAANDTIDMSKTASMNIYKYDLTRAAADKVWDASAYVSSGVYDDSVINALGSGYAIQGVKFAYLKIADIITYTSMGNDTRTNMVLYGMPMGSDTTELLTALGLTYDNAHHHDQDVYYFASDTLVSALEKDLSSNATTTKNALEGYINARGGTVLPETDEYGHTSASGLPLGLYLVVEVEVPENVTCTTDPFLVSLPMTTIDGEQWMYDVTLYPKNNTGAPMLEKTVREAQADTGKNDGSTDNIADGYAHTATGSDGDVMDYQIISTLPVITSAASQLTTYTFVDTLSQGITYNRGDVVIEFFRDAGCAEKLATWAESDGKFNVEYAAEQGGSSMTITMTDAGLTEINTNENVYGTTGVQRGYSACTLRITYAATVNSDASVVYGDGANPNKVVLQWRRTNSEYYDTLNDDCHVYVYGLDLTKEFSDGDGIMGYVRIPSIDVALPIYHGVEGKTLEKGAGHLPGSSLPIGGDTTHAVLAAHSGLASQRMFSDLEQVKLGDPFYLTVLGDTLAYEVDQILVVEPDDTSPLGRVAGQDYVTLITCTPYGINTHRLLVRGKRVPYTPAQEEIMEAEVTAEPSTWRRQYVRGLALGAGILVGGLDLALIGWRLYRAKHRRYGKHEAR